METLIAFLILIGILIWFHELGHFLFAKMFGVKVEVFSIGFGPPLVKKKWGETLYQIAVVPLGGFVKLFGEDRKVEDPRAFSSKPNWQKILIAFAGPFFNFLLTILLFAVVFRIGIEVPAHEKRPALVGYVEENSWAHKAGIRRGDRIIRIGDKDIAEWRQIRRAILEGSIKKRETLEIVVEREGKVLTLRATPPEIKTGREAFGLNPHIPPVVGRVAKELPGGNASPAYQVGIRSGDRILEVNGKPVESWYELVKEVRKTGSKPVKLKIEREGKIIEKEVVPALIGEKKIPLIGISPKIEVVKESYPLGVALSKALDQTVELTVLTFETIKALLTGGISLKTLGGPIAIAQFAGEAAQSGLSTYLFSMAFISLQLGIFNLLPLPVLDGGLILLFLIEMFRRKPLPDRFKEYWQKVGFALIISLMAFVVINDILRVFGG
jgi:regulator of sigma E protease